MKPFTFPVWVLINSLNQQSDGSHYLLIHGGHGTGIPASLSVFPSEEKAKRLVDRHPFAPVKMEWHEFYEALLTHRTQIQEIIFNTGSQEAARYNVNEALELLRQGPDDEALSPKNE